MKSFQRIHEATGIDMTNDVYEMLGYDDGQKKVKVKTYRF